MDTEELAIVSCVVIILLLLMLILSNGSGYGDFYQTSGGNNMRHTHLNGRGLPYDSLPNPYNGGPGEFMNSRYSVVVDDSTDSLNDLTIAGFSHPYFEHNKQNDLPRTSRVQWSTIKSTPTLMNDDIHLQHIAADMTTPSMLTSKTRKAANFLPNSGGRSRLNFSSFENSRDERPFRH